MKIAFTYNVKRNAYSLDLSKQTDIEFDFPEAIDGITKTMESLGHTVHKIEADENAFIKLKKLKDKNEVDLVFTIAEGLWGDARESQIPMFCEVLKIPYTHSSPSTHAITLDKQFTKWILQGAHVVRVPRSQAISSKKYKFDTTLNFPLIVKPNKEGSGKGIVNANVVDNMIDLEKRIKAVTENFTKEVIVEEFIDGREFTVGVLGNNGDFRVLPVIEQQFGLLPKGMHKIAGYELKWIYDYKMKTLEDVYICPAKIDKKLQDEIELTAKELCRVLDIRDAARIDYRLNSKGELYFLEINTLPGINPDIKEASCYPLAARVGGLDFKEMINQIILSACKRYGLKG
jgi:D-alanine-D-alanine ligase